MTPSFNQARYLEQAMLSVLNQNYPNLAYVIIDGGSTDGSVEIIRRHAAELAYWTSRPDGGQAEAIAQGLERASGDICAWLNSDDLYLPGALEVVGTFFLENRAAEFLYGDCVVVDSNTEVRRRIYPIEFRRDIFVHENSIIPQPAAFWRRQAYERAGKVNPRYTFCMDHDLWSRFADSGVRFHCVNELLAAIRVHAASKSARLQAVRRREWQEIAERMLGRPLTLGDHATSWLLRVKRYYLRPRALLEGCMDRVLSWARPGI